MARMVDGRCYNAAFDLRCSTKAGESVVIHGLEIAFRFVDQISLVVLHQKISNQIAVQIRPLASKTAVVSAPSHPIEKPGGHKSAFSA